jgi:phosphoesterase RecJ-like protein
VLQLAGELAAHRLDVHGIHRAIYQSSSMPLLRLLGHVTRGVHEECGGRFAWFVIRKELVRELGVDRLDTDPILDVLRSAGKIEAVALFTEQPDSTVSVSLRSRGDLDVNAVARRFGGGGHTQAAGTTLAAPDAEVQRMALVADIRQRLGPS